MGREPEHRHLHQHDRDPQRLQRKAVDQAADDHLGQRGHRIDRRQQQAEHRGVLDQAPEALGQQLAVAVGGQVEDQAGAGRRQGHHGQHAGQFAPAQRHRGLLAAGRRRLGLGRGHRDEHPAQGQAGEPGHHEGRAPAGQLDQEAGQQRRHRDAQVARQPVQADRRARPRRMLHQHRDAHRVVDRREGAQQRQRGSQLPGVLGGGGQQRGESHAEEEHRHHLAPAPEVAQPAGGQRAQAEQQEGADAIGHQVFPACEAEVACDRRDRGGEDQQEQVVQRVGEVEQQGHRSAHALD